MVASTLQVVIGRVLIIDIRWSNFFNSCSDSLPRRHVSSSSSPSITLPYFNSISLAATSSLTSYSKTLRIRILFDCFTPPLTGRVMSFYLACYTVCSLTFPHLNRYLRPTCPFLEVKAGSHLIDFCSKSFGKLFPLSGEATGNRSSLFSPRYTTTDS